MAVFTHLIGEEAKYRFGFARAKEYVNVIREMLDENSCAIFYANDQNEPLKKIQNRFRQVAYRMDIKIKTKTGIFIDEEEKGRVLLIKIKVIVFPKSLFQQILLDKRSTMYYIVNTHDL